MKSTLPIIVTGLLTILSATRADLLVYEPFFYTPNLEDETAGALAGKNGGLGFAGAWEDLTAGSNNGEGFIFGSAGNTNGTNDVDTPGTPQPNWDGVVDNLPQLGGYVGLSPYNNTQLVDRNNSRRALAQSAGAMAGPDRVLWMSMAVHFPYQSFQIIPGLMLTDGGGFSERSRDITDGSSGIGIGHGSAWGLDLNAITYNAGSFDTRTNVSNLSAAEDHLLVLKFTFGDTGDTVSTWYFPESTTPTEADFDTNALATTSTVDIDENSLTTLAVGFTRAANAFDEIRIGDSFTDIISLPAAGPADADSSTVSASPEVVSADGLSTSSITVSLTDALGVPVSGKAITLQNSAGPQAAAISPSGPQTTDVNGQVSFLVSSLTSGVEAFAATNTTDGFVITDTSSVTFISEADPGLSTVTASPEFTNADGTSTSTITVTLLAPGGIPTPNKDVALAALPATATITPSGFQLTDVNGQVTFDVSSTTPGQVEFTASNLTDGSVVTQTATVDFAGSADALDSTVNASAGQVVADGTSTSTITVSLKDSRGIAVQGEEVTLAALPAGATITPVGTAFTDVNGEVSFDVSAPTPATIEFIATAVGASVTITDTASVEFIDSATPLAFNVSFERFTGGGPATPDPSVLEGPAGGLGESWNQFANPDSIGPVISSSGVVTSVSIDTDFTEGRSGSGANQPISHASLTDFGRTANRNVTIDGLIADALYDIWVIAYRDNGGANERLGGYWTLSNASTSPAGERLLSSFDERNGATFEEGVNFLLYENVVADGNGRISLDGRGGSAADPDFTQDVRLGLSGLQIAPASPARIISFEAAGATGVIDQGAFTIDVTVPFGTDLATLAPTFTLNSGTCDQTSGSAPSPDFSTQNPVDYIVTDGSTTNTYSVTVSVAAQTADIVIALGPSGTFIAGGDFIGTGPTNLPLPALPVGSILKSIDVDCTLEELNDTNDNFASDLTLLFDPTPDVPGGDFSLGISRWLASAEFTVNTELAWDINTGEGGANTDLDDSFTAPDWAAEGEIDLASTGLFLGNNFDKNDQENQEGGTWSGTITLTYEVATGGSAYDSWSGGAPVDGDENGDGVSNGLAFLLGAANPTEDATGRVPTVSETASGLVMSFDCLPSAARGGLELNVQHTSDLGTGDAWVSASVPDSTSGPANGISFDVNPGPTGPPALNRVTATIGGSEAADGRLFGRLQALQVSPP